VPFLAAAGIAFQGSEDSFAFKFNCGLLVVIATGGGLLAFDDCWKFIQYKRHDHPRLLAEWRAEQKARRN
jgi:hypothetical protein